VRGSLARIWIAAAALAAGSAVGDGLGRSVASALLAGVGAAGLYCRRALPRVGCLVCLAFALGWTAAAARSTEGSSLEVLAQDVPRCVVAATVVEHAGGLGTLVSVHWVVCEGHAPVLGAGAVMLDKEVGSAGGRVVGEGWLLPLGDDSFDAARRRLGAAASFDAPRLALAPPPPGPLRVAARVRSGLVAATSSLDGRRAALLRGLTIGDTSRLDSATTELFRRSGLSHLLAVSGSNVAIVIGAVAIALRPLALKARVVAAGAALALFVLVVGPEPSVLRAAAMGAIGLAALAWGRRAEPLHALGLALIAVIGARPHIVYSVGLHLSVAATAGIVLWGRAAGRRLRALGGPVGVGLGATLAAQVAVAPVLLATFGELSVAAPAANLVAMPAVAPATVLGLTAAAAGALDPRAGRLLALAAEPFARWILVSAEWFGAPAWAAVRLPAWTGAVAAIPVVAGAAWSLAADLRPHNPKHSIARSR
jgi:ComEC/Rec2-related protein